MSNKNNKQLLQFVFSRFLSTLGDKFLLFISPLLIYKFTNSIAMSGLAFLIEWLPRIISLPIAGSLSDMMGGRKIYLIADSTRALICLVVFFAVLTMPQFIFIEISILMAISAFFYAQGFIALESTIPQIVHRENLAHAQSMIQGVEQTSAVLGPAIAATIVAILPSEYVLLCTSIVFCFSFISISFINWLPTTLSKRKISVKQVFSDMKFGINIIWRTGNLRYLVGFTFAINLVWGLALASSAAIVTGIFNQSATTYGVLQTTSGVLSVCCFFLIPIIIRYLSIYKIGAFAYAAMILGGLLAGVSKVYLGFFIGYLLIMVCDGLYNIYVRTNRARIIPKEHLGKTIGVIVLINQVSLPLAGLLIATFAKYPGVQGIFLIISLCLIPLLIIFLVKHKQFNN